MAAVTAIAMGASAVAGAYGQSEAQKMQGDYQRNQSEVNARLAGMQGKDAIARGDAEAAQHRNKVERMAASQRASSAAQGLDTNSGTVAAGFEDTRALGQVDEMKIRNNAWREAWGYKVEAINGLSQGRFAQLAGHGAAENTLLTGGMQAIGYGAGYKRKT